MLLKIDYLNNYFVYWIVNCTPLSPAILVSHDFWRQIFGHTFFIYLFFVQKLQHLWFKITWEIEQILICSETKRLKFKNKRFYWNETKSKYIEISICTGKDQWWSPFLIQLQAYSFIKIWLHPRCFLVKFVKFYRT